MDHRTKCKIIKLVEETIGENLHDWNLGDVCLEIASQVALVVKNPPANAGNVRDVGWIYRSGISPGVGCHSLLQGIFPTQELNPDLPHCRWILYRLSHQGSQMEVPTVCQTLNHDH